ncbi:hypothetical protein GCM10011390_12990 [Aureimonas endophytica]|uniref:Uncharacterized protein n=1 Tax=Aureimonas endophytica TaxID=2027858 RepID=A0A917E1R0_9HYPH|nr:hypothetical protein [Aureimonas endophytica]GGD95645.1 hypothetical protein GCM10011390_12990 [Aureimonas endophytica]
MNAPVPQRLSRFQEVLLLVGQLNYSWTNTESLLIHLIAGLARVEKEVAIVIFLTLNTGKARIELVERLAKTRRVDPALRREVLGAMRQMTRQAKLRNKYSHCIYAFDETGSHASTQLMRIFDSETEIRYGKTEDLGPDEMQAIMTAVAEIKGVNAAIWDIVQRYDFPR